MMWWNIINKAITSDDVIRWAENNKINSLHSILTSIPVKYIKVHYFQGDTPLTLNPDDESTPISHITFAWPIRVSHDFVLRHPGGFYVGMKDNYILSTPFGGNIPNIRSSIIIRYLKKFYEPEKDKEEREEERRKFLSRPHWLGDGFRHPDNITEEE